MGSPRQDFQADSLACAGQEAGCRSHNETRSLDRLGMTESGHGPDMDSASFTRLESGQAQSKSGNDSRTRG